ncbi:MAG: sigma-70 region 4 domain-containing protein, partial [Candidatus Neomarinimicrobiota bacterium]|nr:sigma-70 region 4 domain-containing protein [Candidatus Neomarinimicrobiota bacterium]
TKEELWAAIERLPRKQRTVVMMRVAQELPYREIAQVTGMSEGTAKVNFHHALKTLKKWFSND